MSIVLNDELNIINEFKKATSEKKCIKLEFTKIINITNSIETTFEENWMISFKNILKEYLPIYYDLLNIVKEYLEYCYSFDGEYYLSFGIFRLLLNNDTCTNQMWISYGDTIYGSYIDSVFTCTNQMWITLGDTVCGGYIDKYYDEYSVLQELIVKINSQN